MIKTTSEMMTCWYCCSCVWTLAIAQRSLLVYALENTTTDVHSNASDKFQSNTSTTGLMFNVSETYLETGEDEEDNIASCGAVPLEPSEYIMFPNGTAYVEPFNKTYNPISYRLFDDILVVCPPKLESEDNHTKHGLGPELHISFTHITRIGMGISILCLAIHLIVFVLVPDMRNPSGYNLASLCFSLLSAYVFYLVASAGNIEDFRIPCIGAGAAFQFFMTASFLWMSLMSFDIFISILNATGKLRLVSKKFSSKKYGINCLFSWGIPLLFIITTLVLDNVEGVPEKFKPGFGSGRCWFTERNPMLILFVGPIMAIIIINAILFALSAFLIFTNRMKADGDEANRRQLKRNLLVHGRLATIMGLAWIVSIVASIFNTIWLWYIHVIINSLQGFFIFLAFTCTDKVRKYFSAKLKIPERRRLYSNSSSTLRSCWITRHSTDNDLNVLQEDNEIKMETIA